MKILFVTGIYAKESEDYFRHNVRDASLQNAANVFQWGVIEGLYQNQVDFEVVSFPFLPCFPVNYRMLYTLNDDIKLNGTVVGKQCAYCTVPVIKQLSMQYRLHDYVKQWLIKNDSEHNDLVILTYTPMSWMIYPLKSLKKKYKFRICSIIPDLIDDATNPVFKLSPHKYIQARIEQNLIWNSYPYIDKYVLLSEQMQDKIPQARNNFVRVEGLAQVPVIPKVEEKYNTIKTLLYTGSLEYFTGVKNLIDAFLMTSNPEYRLVVCGDGPLADYIVNSSHRDDRIIYKGIVSREESVKLQGESTLLVNPRIPEVSLTMYSFPSKTMEYLISGTPMIGYRLDGIPEEYYEHFYIPEDFSVVSLKETIMSVLSLPSYALYEKARKAQDFILNNKTPGIQVRKIIDYLEY